MIDQHTLQSGLPRHSATSKAGRRAGVVAGLALAGLMLAGCEVAPRPSVGAAPGYGYTCYAGVYVCHTQTQVAVGAPCSCPGIGAPSFGRVQ